MLISQYAAFGGKEAAIAILEYLQAPAVGLYFVGANLYAIIKVHKPNKLPIKKQNLIAAAVFLTLIALSYVAQAIFYLVEAFSKDELVAPQHSVIHVLGGLLISFCLLIALFTNKKPILHPHFGAWGVGLILEASICGLYAATLSQASKLDQAAVALSILRITCFIGLLVDAVHISRRSPAVEKSSAEERERLLPVDGTSAAANGSTSPPVSYGSTAVDPAADNEDEDDDQKGDDKEEDEIIKLQRARIQEQGGWLGYLKGFSVFLPYIWPSNDWIGKLCVFVMAFDIVIDRILNVLTPRQIGIVTNKLSSGDSFPWKETLIWFLLRWLPTTTGIGMWRWAATQYVENYSRKQISDRAFAHVMDLSMDFHSNKDSGEVYKAVEQADSLTTLLDMTLDVAPVLIDLIIAMCYVTYLFDIYLAFVIIVLCVFYLWIGIHSTAWTQPLRRTYNENARNESKTVVESVSNWQTVSYFNRADYERQRYKDAISTTIRSYWAYVIRQWIGMGAQSLLMQMAFNTCAILAIWEVSAGRKPLGNFITFIMYWSTITSPLSRVTYSIRYMASSLVDAERVLQLMNTKVIVADTPDSSVLKAQTAEVEFDNVAFAYDERKPVLKGISFTAQAGQTIALVGETGGGKSTVLKLLFRFYDVTSGSIRIDGQDLRAVNISSLREALGVVPQDPSMFNQPIIDNIRYARLEATDEEIHEACKAAAVHDKIMSFPDGYKSKVGERGVKLSGGELQRIAIARVLVKNPKIVMLDEATSAVDSATEQQIQEAFRKLSSGRTTFVVAHRLSTIMEADLILVIDHGEIIERGTHDQLLLRGGKYSELWTKQTTAAKSARSSKPSSNHGGDDNDTNAAEGASSDGKKAKTPALLINDLPAETFAQELARTMTNEDKDKDKDNGEGGSTQQQTSDDAGSAGESKDGK